MIETTLGTKCLYVYTCLLSQQQPVFQSHILTYFITYLLSYLLTYLLTPWSRVLLEKLTDFQLAKKFPEFYGTRMFITALTSVRHLLVSFIYSSHVKLSLICLVQITRVKQERSGKVVNSLNSLRLEETKNLLF